MKVLCAQLGARQNYEIPWHFSKSGQLSLLATDFWNPLGNVVKFGGPLIPKVVARVQSRFREGIPSRSVRICPSVAYDLSRLPRLGVAGGELLARLSVRFARFTAECVAEVKHDCMLSYCGAALESLEAEKKLGNSSALAQYDTGPELEETIAAESLQFRELKQQVIKLPAWHYERLREEWRLANIIIVNSTWTQRSLISLGVPAEKIEVIPLSILPARPDASPKQGRKGNLRVLWLGRFCLGKGLAYALEAARLVEQLPIEFTFVGGSWVDQSAIQWPQNCHVLGHVPRTQVAEIYAAHDVFLFPTLSDGFGRVQLEAMSNGLPVIATRCCGDVVEDGQSGFIVPPRDPRAIA